MSPATAKGLKIGGIVLLIGIAIYIIYYFMKGGSSSSSTTWLAKPGCDAYGNDISTDYSSLSLSAAKAKAETLGAVAFLQNGITTYFKSAAANPTCGGSGYTLYVKQ